MTIPLWPGYGSWRRQQHCTCDPIGDFGNIKFDHDRSTIKYGVPWIRKFPCWFPSLSPQWIHQSSICNLQG